MLNPRTIHFYNENVSNTLAIVLNCLLLYLIKTRTTKKFMAYSKVLLITCFQSLLLAVSALIVRPRVDVIEGRLFFIVDGIVGGMSLPVSYAGMNITVGLVFFEICILPLQYEFRYSLVCRNKPLSRTFVCAAVCLALLAQTVHFVLAYRAVSPLVEVSERNRWLLERDPLWATDLPQFTVSNMAETRAVIVAGYWALMILVSYSIVIYTSYCISRKFTEVKHLMTDHTVKMHDQLAKVLRVEALLPFFGICVPVIMFISHAALSAYITDVPRFSVYGSLAINWIPMLSPLATMYFVPQYRRAISGFFRPKVYAIERSNDCSVVKPNNEEAKTTPVT